MTRRSKIWLVLAALFTLVNLGGAPVAAASSEMLHAAVHVVLALLGAYVVWRLAPRNAPLERPQDPPRVTEADERLQYLQHSVDAIALEVERIGEAQRFAAKLHAERAGAPSSKPMA